MYNLAMSTEQNMLSDKNRYNGYLTFYVSDKVFAVSLLKVREILECCEITVIPRLPQYIRGAINLRGNVIPVLDLASVLGYGATEISKRTCIVVVEIHYEGESIITGVLVGSVSQVLNLSIDDAVKPPSFGGNVDTRFIEAMGKINEKFVVILDISKIISIDDIDSLDLCG